MTDGPVTASPLPVEWNAIAARLCRTTLVPEAYRGRHEDVLAAVMFGREIGLGPMASLRDICMIDGRPVLAAAEQLHDDEAAAQRVSRASEAGQT